MITTKISCDEIPQYSQLNCDSLLVNKSTIYVKWKEDRRNISRRIVSKKNLKPLDILPQSSFCSCNVTGNSCYRNICTGCSIVSRLYFNGEIKIDVPKNDIIICCYDNMNQKHKYVKNRTENDVIFLRNDSFPFYHYIVLSCIIEYEMNKIEIPCVPSFMWSWICSNKLCIVEKNKIYLNELTNYSIALNSPLSPVSMDDQKISLKIETGRSILAQLCICLDFLSLYDTLFTGVNSKCIWFEITNTQFTYKNINIDDNILLHLNPTGFTSIKIGRQNEIRLYSENNIFRRLYNVNDFNVIVNNGWYKIGKNYQLFIDNNIKKGYFEYSSSLNLYVFLVILLTDYYYNIYYEGDAELRPIIRSLFIDNNDYNIFIHSIESNIGNDICYEKIIHLLSHLNLKINAVPHVLSQLNVLFF